MHKITIIAGISLDRDNKPIHATLTKLQNIRRRMAKDFGGYTETISEGGWINPLGELVEEIGRTWTIYAEGDFVYNKAHKLAEFVSFELNQDSVVLEVIESGASFINQPTPAAAAAA